LMPRHLFRKAALWAAAGLVLGVLRAAWPELQGPNAFRAGAARVDITLKAEMLPASLGGVHDAEEAVVKGLLESVGEGKGEQYKVDPKKIALMGESAGAHLVDVVGARNRPPADVAAVVSFYGPIDLVKLLDARPGAPGAAAAALKTLFGITELDERAMARVRAASPNTWINSR